MEADREEQLEAIFAAAVEREPAARGAVLAEACGDDAMLREEIDALLAADARATDFLETPPLEVEPTVGSVEVAPDMIGRSVGRYRVRSIIASGGMGTVYEATQEKPRRSVALKVMRRGIASPSALRRFEHEPELIARLRHPGIARVYEAGTYDDGTGAVPYFAMEYVPGARPILDYALDHSLSIRARLELFAEVCDAVHHGHQHGIVHRDLKPGNILVDAGGRCRIIDFGVARSTDSDLAATTCQTEVGLLLGTVRYMSPEQFGADPHDVDARSDVYALGVVLYELLCGRPPYDVSEERVFEWARLIREQDPVRPGAIEHTLHGDVESIVLTALEKRRERRYQSAAALGRDIEGHLRGEPIAARRHGGWYALRGELRGGLERHRLAVVVVTAVLALAAATGAMLTGMHMEERRHEQQTALLDESAGILRTIELVGQPGPEARSQLERAYEIHHRHLGDDHPETLRTMDYLSHILMVQWELPKAEDLVLRLIDGWRGAHGDDHTNTMTALHRLGVIMQYRGRLDEAEPLLRELLDRRRRLFGDDHPETLAVTRSLGLVLRERGRLEEAEALMRVTVERHRHLLGARDAQTMSAINVLGGVVLEQGAHVEAERLFRESHELRATRLGPDHPSTLTSARNIARALLHQGRLSEAAMILLPVIETQQHVLPPSHPEPVRARAVLARVRLAQGRVSEAVAGYRDVVEAARDVYPGDHWRRALYDGRYGHALSLVGADEQAEEHLRSAHEHLAAALGPDHARTREIRAYLREP